MSEKSWPWSTVAGLGDGAAELGESDSRVFLASYFGARDLTEEGVSKGVLNELEVTGAASPLQVDTGSGICYGLYYNDAALNLTVTTPAIGTTGGRVVLQTNWAGTGGASLEARTRAAVVLNSDGVAAIPALTQTFGTTWEISLATFTITTGGVISLTDDRTFRKVTGELGDDEVGTNNIIDENVTADKIENRTRAFWLHAHGWDKTNDIPVSSGEAGITTENGVQTSIRASFIVPNDFLSNLTIKIIMSSSNAAGNLAARTLGPSVLYAAVGENYDTHQHFWSNGVIAVSNSDVITVLETMSLTNAAIGDIVQVDWWRYGTDAADTADIVSIAGYLVEYTADS